MITDIADREVADAARALEGVAVRTPLQYVAALDACFAGYWKIVGPIL